ncbi:MAG: N-acetylmuramic acid 6-phosphate etherase [Phycisphaera sp.]|nr:MAG: N-acetylmuramic acid 6-phosphate etherase [Phycisphaera sp.]
MANQPIDRSHLSTEQMNPAAADLHAMSVVDCVQLINQEDALIAQAVAASKVQISALISAAEHGFSAAGRLIYLGAGTSGRLGVLDASEAPPTFHVEPGKVVGIIAGGDSALRTSSESAEDDPHGARGELAALKLSDDDTLVGIAAGGTTPYVRGAFDIARSFAPRITTGMITCSDVEAPPSCEHLILLDTGPEVIAGSTRMKAGTATKLVLNTISTTLMVRSGRVYQNLMVDMRPTNDKLRDRAARVVSRLTGLEREQALKQLDIAGNSVKAAVVMHTRGVNLDTASRLLENARGRLGDVLQGHAGPDLW